MEEKTAAESAPSQAEEKGFSGEGTITGPYPGKLEKKGQVSAPLILAIVMVVLVLTGAVYVVTNKSTAPAKPSPDGTSNTKQPSVANNPQLQMNTFFLEDIQPDITAGNAQTVLTQKSAEAEYVQKILSAQNNSLGALSQLK